MIKNFLKKIFFSKEDILINEFFSKVKTINGLEKSVSQLTDEKLKVKTIEFKKLIKERKTQDDILCEVFAVVREVAKRVIGLRHFDVQLLGAIALYKGKIAEMATGEGKTLAVTASAYLHALKGLGIHIVTVNDYLAKRDFYAMGKIFNFLGLSVGCVLSDTSEDERKKAYLCDITYVTNNELGFDYLRDNMKFSQQEKVQRKLYAACIDEIDSVLIDDARTPLVISSKSEENLSNWNRIQSIIITLSNQDYSINTEKTSVVLTEKGTSVVESLLKKSFLISEDTNLYDYSNTKVLYQVSQILKANFIMCKDIDYIVSACRVLCIEKNTGRASKDKRFSNGLHQAIEAKEGVEIIEESDEIASISFQNYFKMYKFLSGMTGTAITEKEEFKAIYDLDVLSIPCNKRSRRIDYDDIIFGTIGEKDRAIINLVKEKHEKGQPILIGTENIQESEKYSALLKKSSIKHNVLNAKNHEQEAYIIAQAGCYKSVTISTNMAGRGTDIMLGGNYFMSHEYKKDNVSIKKLKEVENRCIDNKKKVKSLGGLLVIGTSRHKNKRLDNQLIGRSGRQGDEGESQFFLSLSDNLVKTFSSTKTTTFLKKMILNNDEPIQHKYITRLILNAQRRIEGQYFDQRKHLLQFDNVLNEQRKIIYKQRDLIMQTDQIQVIIFDIIREVIKDIVDQHTGKNSDYNLEKIFNTLNKGFDIQIDTKIKNSASEVDVFIDNLVQFMRKMYFYSQDKEIIDYQDNLAKYIFLRNIDQNWQNHIAILNNIKEGIHNRAYGQQDPLQEYKKESFYFFEQMLNNFRLSFIKSLYKIVKENNSCVKPVEDISPEEKKLIKRNSLCYCMSGKKYKKCHGVN